MDSKQERSNITVSHKNFRIVPDKAVRNGLEQSKGSVPAPGTENSLYVLVSEHAQHVRKTGFIFPCQIIMLAVNMRRKPYLKPNRFQYFQAGFKVRLFNRAGRRDYTYPVSRPEFWRFYD